MMWTKLLKKLRMIEHNPLLLYQALAGVQGGLFDGNPVFIVTSRTSTHFGKTRNRPERRGG